jgi:threonine synthase
MARAWREGAEEIGPEHVVARPTGIAAAILRGNPSRVYPHVRRIVRASGGTFAAVTEEAIREARRLVEELEGISPCFAAAAAVAGVVQLRRRGELAPADTVLVNLTGREREGPTAIAQPRRLERSDRGWAALAVPA